MSSRWKIFLLILLLGTLAIWFAVFSSNTRVLRVISCNVGQGDASLIVYKNFEILIDGGPGNDVLNCLSKYIPFWDREIEVVVITHPQADHYTGIISVLDDYKVDKILANSLNSSNHSYTLLKNKVLNGGVEVVNPVRGTSIRWNLIQLDILNPSKEFLAENYKDISDKNNSSSSQSVVSGSLGTSESNLDPNEFSIVALLKFDSFSFLFTGDASARILDELASTLTESGIDSINYIKVPHHGSKSALSSKFYDAIGIDIAGISVGKNNYGHPNQEILDELKNHGIRVLRTDQVGDIVMETDGKRIWVNGK